MIRVKATAEILSDDGGEANVGVECEFNGTGDELVHEAIAVIRSVCGHLKEQSIVLHAMLVQQIASDSSILLGKEDDRVKAELASLMSRNVIKKGVN